MARKRLGRELTADELEQTKKGIEFGFEFWEDVVVSAIDELKNR